MKNSKIRVAIFEAGLRQWEVAQALGLSESAFSRLLRRELSDEEKNKILSVIEKIGGRGENMKDPN